MIVYVLTFQSNIDNNLSILGVYSSRAKAILGVKEWMEPQEEQIGDNENGMYYSIYTTWGEYLITQRFVE